MMLLPIGRYAIPAQWETIAAVLKPAVDRDPVLSMGALRRDLDSGILHLWRPTIPAQGFVVTQAAPPVLWVIYVSGHSGGFKAMRALMDDLEEIARDTGCSELRFEGRDWRRVYPDFEHEQTADGRHHFRKRLS